MSLAILCSGQGGQHADMFRLTGKSPLAEPLFEHAESWFGEDPRAWVRGANISHMRDGRGAQLLCVLQALAAAAVLDQDIPRRCCIAGYSVGELAAWSVAGLLSASDTLALAVARADVMSAACLAPQGMLGIRGLSLSQINEVIRGLVAEVAIVNPNSTHVVGGLRDDLVTVATRARHQGAVRVITLPVYVASHTHLLSAASVAFEKRMETTDVTPIRTPETRIFSGIDGEQVTSISDGVQKLSRQISQRIQWSSCLESCVESGTTTFLELGPGRALSEMVVATYPTLQARSMDDFQTMDGVRAWLRRSLVE